MKCTVAADAPAAEVVWQNEPQLGVSPVNVQPFVQDGVMYGFDQSGRMYAVELPSGKRLWETTKPVSDRPAYSGTAFIVRQGDEGQRYWLFNERGQIIDRVRGDRPDPTADRADESRVWPGSCVVHAGVCEPAVVRAE